VVLSDICVVHGQHAATLTAVGLLRSRAWGTEIKDHLAADRFGIDDQDRHSWHLIIWSADRLVAAGRLTACVSLDDLPDETSFGPYRAQMATPAGFAGRLVVDPPYRGRGLAESIIVARLELARTLGLAQVWGETRRTAVDGLIRHGYVLRGDSLDRSVPGEWSILSVDL
jgi:GNAT superfamily N-acetyltransferase